MIKKTINLLAILMGILILNGCEKTKNEKGFSQPIVINNSVVKDNIIFGSDTVKTGPLKDYEIDSDVIYALSVTSEKPLSKFLVSSTAVAISKLSHIVRTEPAEAIDTSNGIFTKKLNEVVIYYAYHIHPLVIAKTSIKVTFTLLDNSNQSSVVYAVFSTIKQGSTNGKLLKVINEIQQPDIGTQFSLCEPNFQGIWQEGLDFRSRGPFYSFKDKYGYQFTVEAMNHIDDIDFVGYITRYAGTNPVLVESRFYLASPSDSVLLTSTYAGAVAASIQFYGTSGTANITYAGITKLATFTTDLDTTASAFVTANAAAYTAIGLTLTVSSAKLSWTATLPGGAGFAPVQVTTLTGDLIGVNDVTTDLRKNVLMRETIRKMAKTQLAAGKTMRTVYFKRLDNIVGPNKVTPAMFDLLTHDNEFGVLLAGIEAEGKIRTADMAVDQVYGFVMSNGVRGLLRTPTTGEAPESSPYNLICNIKYQDSQ